MVVVVLLLCLYLLLVDFFVWGFVEIGWFLYLGVFEFVVGGLIG